MSSGSAAPATVVLWAEAGNAAMHTGMALRERRYNPGLGAARPPERAQQ